MLHRRVFTTVLLSLVLFAAIRPALAVDGVIEISQAGIEDAGGFPFVISTAGSYRLTGNLTVATDVSAISINSGVRFVTLDLNGFTIRGPAIGNSSGIFSSADAFTVRNGAVDNFGGSGIDAFAIHAEDLIVTANDDNGINASGPSLIRNVIARSNDNGVRLTQGLVTGCVLASNLRRGLIGTTGSGGPSVVGYSNNTITNNLIGTVDGGVDLGGNLCGTTTTCP